MSATARIKKAERIAHARKGRQSIAVHFEGQDFVTCEGRKIPLAEWERGQDCAVLRVVYETRPITNEQGETKRRPVDAPACFFSS